MRNIILFFTLKYEGNWEKIYNAFINFEKIDYLSFIKLNNLKHDNFITMVDNNYPNELKKVTKPPFILFLKGNSKFLTNDFLKIIILDTSLNNKDLIDLKTHLNEFVFIVNYKNKKLINQLLKNKIKIIAITNKGIINISKDIMYNKIINSNNLIISESFDIKINRKFNDFYLDRLLIGLANKILVLKNIQSNFDFLNIFETNNTQIFSLKENKIKNTQLIKLNSLCGFKKICNQKIIN